MGGKEAGTIVVMTQQAVGIRAETEFVQRFSGVAKLQMPMSRYSTMQVGGAADVFAVADSPQLLIEAVGLARELGLRVVVVAGGSNLLFTDVGFRGVVVWYTANEIIIDESLHIARVQSGCLLSKLITDLAAANWGGITFLANIPGSLGGAVVGNAGCYGKEIADILVGAKLWNFATNKEEHWTADDFGFIYRHSKLKEVNNFLVLEAVLKIKSENKKDILDEMKDEKMLRVKKHPQQPSCGSFFKNPERGVPAWKFIEEASMKGAVMGGAKVSPKHANHIVNMGGATAADVLNLARWVKKNVGDVTGVELEAEVRMVDEVGEYLEI